MSGRAAWDAAALASPAGICSSFATEFAASLTGWLRQSKD
jgi:hypothetical protein